MFILILLQFSFIFSAKIKENGNKAKVERLFLNETYFERLLSYHSYTTFEAENKYPWIARVIHSVSHFGPQVCTALCIDPYVFITAARCLVGLKIRYTTVLYKQEVRLRTKAFVLPSKPTRHMFDDIGFIVTTGKKPKNWSTVKWFKHANRTDDQFYWFENLEPSTYKVVGFTLPKNTQKIVSAEHIYNLTQLDITVNINLCANILTFQRVSRGYYVPCYLACTLEEYIKHYNAVFNRAVAKNEKKRIPKCLGYHGVEGGAVIDKKTNELFGVATWGSYSTTHVSDLELPVGFSVPNTKTFYEDLKCAKKIVTHKNVNIAAGELQKLCDSKK